MNVTLSARTVVLFDDEPNKVKYFEKALVDSRYSVEVPGDINKAWDYFEESHPEVCAVLLDIMLPVPRGWAGRGTAGPNVDIGLELLKRLFGQLKKAQEVPIAIFTQLAPGENALMFQNLERIYRAGYPEVPMTTWLKVGLDPDVFQIEFTTWLAQMRSLARFKRP